MAAVWIPTTIGGILIEYQGPDPGRPRIDIVAPAQARNNISHSVREAGTLPGSIQQVRGRDKVRAGSAERDSRAGTNCGPGVRSESAGRDRVRAGLPRGPFISSPQRFLLEAKHTVDIAQGIPVSDRRLLDIVTFDSRRICDGHSIGRGLV
jgi:hypothetical protein